MPTGLGWVVLEVKDGQGSARCSGVGRAPQEVQRTGGVEGPSTVEGFKDLGVSGAAHFLNFLNQGPREREGGGG